MTDLAKRRTLKGIAAATAGTATASLATHSFAATEAAGLNTVSFSDPEGHLAIHTRLSPKSNDIEAIFVNAGSETLNIKSITPHEVVTFRGRFNIAALTEDKPLVLAPGDSVSVGIAPNERKMKFHELIRHGQSLNRALQASATAVTTGGVPIRISVNETLPFA